VFFWTGGNSAWLADVNRLTGKTYRHGILILLDIILNHTSDQHAWFKDEMIIADGEF
jgi:oligo-1,6-glucosidase